MKNIKILFLVFCLCYPLSVGADDFLGAPIVPQGKEIKKSDSRLEIKTDMSHDEAVKFYKMALQGMRDIKFREWKVATYIEDDGKLAWHSITISKGDEEGTSITIVKDNWTWIIGTLILRYIGVFVVLMVLFMGLAVSGKIISSVVTKMEAKREDS